MDFFTGKTFSTLFVIVLLFHFNGFSQGDSKDLQQEIMKARDMVIPALVHIEPVRTVFSTGEKRHALVTGSGFIFSRDGYILTNHHVVENAEKLTCTLYNRKKLPAEIIGSDPSTDVAVIRLNLEEWEGETLPYAELGNSDSLEVGQFVLALGSPLGLSRSVSMGVISSIDRYFEDRGSMISPYNLWIQTDAAINPGNSGGPLINLDGKVIGINARGVFLAENLGFAIPINLANEMAGKLLAGDTIRRSWIGLELQPLRELKQYLKKPDLSGVLVSNLDPGSPAIKSGIRPGDVIQSINELQINVNYEEDLPAVRKILSELPVSQEANIKLWRDGKIKKITVIPQPDPFEYHPEFEAEDWGLVVKNINRTIFYLQGLTQYDGIYISAVKSGEFAERAGLRPGDVIKSINQQKIHDIKEFKQMYQEIRESDPDFIFFEILRQATPYFAAIDLRKWVK
ncbi:MAG: PDZ domain-containing protein [Calditrichaeota bacterium]|nr:trypsin-like peptidase domain-containing protein [Calditrichota bacterium]RQV93520.1 MAG: PDZ domain-containing protein [bacterium]RQW06434.1 MAG: PDZ domain-containing protein [Calditrichota bacterium]